mgnify:CR=1 FL=1
MERHQCSEGLRVIFGSKNGAKTLGKVIKLNPTTAIVEQLEQRNSKPAGTKWSVKYEALTCAPVGTTPAREIAKDYAINTELTFGKPYVTALYEGMKVIFGRGKGEKTLGEVISFTEKNAKIRQTEARGVHTAGHIWNVARTLIQPAGNREPDVTKKPKPLTEAQESRRDQGYERRAAQAEARWEARHS